VLGMLPTGAGKSLCYQLPALLLPHPTLVVSPLIALMKDQVDGLPPAVYPKATLINSSLDQAEAERRLAAIAAGEYRLIYAAPERCCLHLSPQSPTGGLSVRQRGRQDAPPGGDLPRDARRGDRLRKGSRTLREARGLPAPAGPPGGALPRRHGTRRAAGDPGA